MKRNSYTYATLRYVHDLATQEFFTVGVAVLSPEEDFLAFHFRRSLGLAGEIFNGTTLRNFRALMRTIESRSKQIQAAFEANVLATGMPASLGDHLLEFFPEDDSALQWSEIRSGLTSDVRATATRLFARYCGKYDRAKSRDRVTDRDAWQTFHRELVDRRLDPFFSEKRIQGKVDDVKFPFAWKNGIWHCIEPISFDLADGDSIRDKAHRHVGEISAIRDANEAFAVYFVATPPGTPGLDDAFNKAVKLLEGAPHEGINVICAGNEGDLLDDFAKRIQTHAN